MSGKQEQPLAERAMHAMKEAMGEETYGTGNYPVEGDTIAMVNAGEGVQEGTATVSRLKGPSDGEGDGVWEVETADGQSLFIARNNGQQVSVENAAWVTVQQ